MTEERKHAWPVTCDLDGAKTTTTPRRRWPGRASQTWRILGGNLHQEIDGTGSASRAKPMYQLWV